MAECLTTLRHRYVTERSLGVMITDVFTAGISFQEVSSHGIMWYPHRGAARINGKTLLLLANAVTGLKIA
jgi:hypothetical protein